MLVSKEQYVLANMEHCTTAVYCTGMLYLHNNFFLTDIVGYDRAKFC